MKIEIPESVSAYFKDPQIRAGVDAMLTKADKLPADLKWSEMAAYYRALAAAQRLIVDHAMLLQEVWTATWGPIIPSKWMPLDPDEQVADEDQSPHPKMRWDEGTFIRCFTLELRTIYTGIWLNESGFRFGFGVFKSRTGTSALRAPIDGFDLDPNDECFWQATPVPLGDESTLEIDRLSYFGEQALQVIAKAR